MAYTQLQKDDVEFMQLQTRKHMPKVMYILGYGLDDLGFKSHQGHETSLSSKLKGKQYIYQIPLRKPPYLSLRPRAPHSTSTIPMEEWGTHFS